MDMNEGTSWEEPSESDKELTAFIISHTDRWRDSRDENYLEDWKEYERIFWSSFPSEAAFSATKHLRTCTGGVKPLSKLMFIPRQ